MSPAPRPVAGALALIRVLPTPASFRSSQPAACHRALGRSLLGWVVAATREAGCDRVLVAAAQTLLSDAERDTLVQEKSLAGVEWLIASDEAALERVVAEVVSDLAEATPRHHCLVLSAEAPCVEAGLLHRMLERARETGEPVVCSGERSGETAIALEVSRLGEVASLDSAALAGALPASSGSALQIAASELEQLSRVDDRAALSRSQTRLRQRILDRVQEEGVTVIDPARVVIEAGVEVAPDVILHPDVALLEGSVVGRGCELHQGAWLRASKLGERVTVNPYSVLDGAQVADGCQVGPFARLRPGTSLGQGARIGNFVEVKASTLGEGSKANHLAYIGDAEIGERVNIGAGAVTCNYDGAQKHRTEIGDDAFVGSDTMLVAPVRVGKRSLTAAGSVINQDVPDDSLAVGRARQRNVEGWAKRKGPLIKKQALQESKERKKTDDGS